MKGYKIYRSNAGIKRRGCAIFVTQNLNNLVQPIAKDPEGRYIKLKITNNENNDSFTIPTIYLEPNKEHHLEIIPQHILQSDILFGDMNKAITGFTKYERVYHVKGLEELDHIEKIQRGISEHNMIIFSYQTSIQYRQSSKKINIIDKKLAQQNYSIITQITTGQEITETFINPRKTITINTNIDTIDNQTILKNIGQYKNPIMKNIK